MDASANANGRPVVYRVGADIGGTFTDVVLIGSDGSIATKKVSSTPDSFGRAIVEGVSELIAEEGVAADALVGLAHASTIATNAIIELKGARTGLITTGVFATCSRCAACAFPFSTICNIESRRRWCRAGCGLRSTSGWGRVARSGRHSTRERRSRPRRSSGMPACSPSRSRCCTPTRIRRTSAASPRSCASILPNGVYVTCSADVLPEIREYERTSTAVVNAYVGPVVRDYLDALERDIRAIGIARAAADHAVERRRHVARQRAREAGLHRRIRPRGGRDRQRPHGARARACQRDLASTWAARPPRPR